MKLPLPIMVMIAAFTARGHLNPHRPGRLPDWQRVLGAVLHGARHSAQRRGTVIRSDD